MAKLFRVFVWVLWGLFVGLLFIGTPVLLNIKYQEYKIRHDDIENEILYPIETFNITSKGVWVVEFDEQYYYTRSFLLLDSGEESLDAGYYLLLEKRDLLNVVEFSLNAYTSRDRHYRVTIVIVV